MTELTSVYNVSEPCLIKMISIHGHLKPHHMGRPYFATWQYSIKGQVVQYSGTSPCGHPTYVDTMLLWALFLKPIHGVHSIMSFTTVDTPQLWTLFVRPLGFHICKIVRFYCTSISYFQCLKDCKVGGYFRVRAVFGPSHIVYPP